MLSLLGWHLGHGGVMEAWLLSWCCPVPSLLALDKFQPLLLPGNPAAGGAGAPLAAGAALSQVDEFLVTELAKDLQQYHYGLL